MFYSILHCSILLHSNICIYIYIYVYKYVCIYLQYNTTIYIYVYRITSGPFVFILISILLNDSIPYSIPLCCILLHYTRGLGFRVLHMGGCQNYAPFWGTLNNRCRIIIRTQQGTIILTTTHMGFGISFLRKAGSSRLLWPVSRAEASETEREGY